MSPRILAVRSALPDNLCVQAELTEAFAFRGRMSPAERSLLERLHAAAEVKTRHAALRYTTLRLGLFLAALAVVWVIAKITGMDLNSQTSKLSLLAVAIFVSSAVSFVVLSKQRDAMSAGIVARSQKLSQKLDQAASFEDE